MMISGHSFFRRDAVPVSGVALLTTLLFAKLMFTTSLMIAAQVIVGSCSLAQADEPSALPPTSIDQIVIRKGLSKRGRTQAGVIEDISGQNVVLRRSGNTVEIIKLRDITTLRFQKSAEFVDGLIKLRSREWPAALVSLQAAAKNEPRMWVVREIRAAIAQTQRALGQFEECMATVESILEQDPESRHAVELPLTWDERLPQAHRIVMNAADLQSRSLARRLTAASAVLQDSAHQESALLTLQAVQQSARGVLQQLAETQQWRIRLLQPDGLKNAEISRWTEQAHYYDRRTRSGPEFLIGRALMAVHDYDNAATSLLWMPLLEPLDPPTTAASLADAITALEMSGRTMEAARLRAEISESPPQPTPAAAGK